MTGAVPKKKSLTQRQPLQVQEFSLRIPKKNKKRYHLMRFNATQAVKFKEWKRVGLHRENNLLKISQVDGEIPKFGAGSEFGREAREVSRRHRLGIRELKYKSEDQPWILNVSSSESDDVEGKTFKGIREGGVGDNSTYYIFSHSANGIVEAHPLHEWYKFQPVQRYQALSAEEAEEEFNRRDEVLNYFSLMTRKRLRSVDEIDEEIQAAISKSKGKKELKISEMDEWMDSEDEDEDDDSADSDGEKKTQVDEQTEGKKNKKGNLKNAKKKKKNGLNDEAIEESDDGDEEGRECDYVSDSSASDSELEQQKEIKSVAEESGLRNLLSSDDEEDEDSDDDETDEDEEKKDEEEDKDKDKTSQCEDKEGSCSNRGKDCGNGSNNSSSDAESEIDKETEKKLDKSPAPINETPKSRIRKESSSSDEVKSKKAKLECCVTPSPGKFSPSDTGITVEVIRRYLMRKPITMIDLLKKIRSKKTGLNRKEIGDELIMCLTKINPYKHTLNGVIYYSLQP